MTTAEEPRSCPQCGAAAARDEADAFATCGFCGARLFLGDEPGVSHELLLPAVSPEELPARLRAWLDDREALGAPRNVSSKLLFFPFWVRARAGVSDVALAAPSLADGLRDFRLPAGDAKTFSARATGQAEVVAATVAREALPFADAPPGELRLVHVPFHEVSFNLFDRAVRVWIDAVAGQAIPLDPIPTSEANLDRAYAFLLFVLFAAAFAGFHALFRGATARGAVFLLVAGPLILLATRGIAARMEDA
ncbi:MAG: hypothetical protein PT977_07615 [Acidobacteriota bacterium]|nr:hypothetical protein [Acidobacteriota bacterium]